ncbi:MAG: hypothetical protein E6G97_01040 [Alphaproteobacteria bacterium]|nr:MAG: hypothetical protein E6G97_01040 [Alphaproteobacteria bacterium]
MGTYDNGELAAGAALDDETTEATNAVYFSPAAASSPYRLYQWYLDGYLTAGSNDYGANVDKISTEYSGHGVLIGLIDTGFDLSNADLAGRFDLSLSYDPRDAGSSDIRPDNAADSHGTWVAGVVGADGNNGIGIVGVAPEATLVGYYARFGLGGSSGIELANLLARQVNVDVSNNSWGYNGAFADNFRDASSIPFRDAILEGVTEGRGGLGTSYVFAAGNDRQYVANSIAYDGDNTNYHSLTNSRFITTVAASNADGHIASFSRPGDSILVAAPGQWIATTNPTNGDGNLANDITFLNGTSFAAPVVSGAIAMMLEANPDLGYRDVQEILALSARKIDQASASWSENGATNWNGGGNLVSHDFGFGLIDAHAAVRLAETWSTTHTAANEQSISVAGTVGSNTALVDFHPNAYTATVSSDYQDFSIDWVEIDVSLLHTFIGDLRITLISPTGTESVLVDRPTGGQNPRDNLDFTFSTNHDWGESPVGTWRLIVSDEGTGGTGSMGSFTLHFYGDDEGQNDTYYYTDDFATLSGDRTTLTDAAGNDTINAAAVTTDMVLDLTPGATLTIAGRQVVGAAGTVIENAYGGDGNDVLIGNASDNILSGGAGNDTLDGQAGADTLTGGRGADVFVYVCGDGADRIADFSTGEGDTVDLSGARIATFAGLLACAMQVGADTVIAFEGGDTLTLEETSRDKLGAASFVFAPISAPSDLILSNRDVASYGHAGTVVGSLTLIGGNLGASFSYSLLGDGGPFAIEGSNLVLASDVTGPQSFDLTIRVTDSDGNVLDRTFTIAAMDLHDLVAAGAAHGPHNYAGGAGNDIYYVANSADTVVEHLGAGLDTVLALASYTLGANVEALTLVEGAGLINGTGNSQNNTITGNSSDNVIDGGAGADALSGGAGNDTYFVDNAGDMVIEHGNDGIDTVHAAISYALAANTEILILDANAGAIDGTGNDLDNVIIGNINNNIIDGGAGTDTVDYASATHAITVDLSASVNQATGPDIGTDQLVNIENVIGGSGNDTLLGNSAANLLSGGAGADTLIGHGGDDVYDVDNPGDVVIENAAEGRDVVKAWIDYVLPANVEALVLAEGAGNIHATGNDADNTLIGNSGNNVLDGRGGNDTMAGGAGDDAYYVDSVGDVVVENTDGGNDVIYTWVDYAPPANVEAVALMGGAHNLTFGSASGIGGFTSGTTGETAASDDPWTDHATHYGYGNALDNVMVGGAGNETFFAGDGSDTLSGGDGNDVLVANTLEHLFTQEHDALSGGAGNDTLYGEAADTLDGGAGFDVLQAINDYGFNLDLVATGIEYVVSGFGDDVYTAASGATAVEVYGSGGNDQITGGAGNDNLWGGVGDDTLIGNDGNDLLVGDLGADSLSGGAGNDRLYIDSDDTFIDGGSGFDAAYIATGTGVHLNLAATHLEWVTDFAGGDDTIDGSGVGVNLEIYGGGGDDTLIGGAGNDLIFAGSGNDAIAGGDGDDALVGEAGADSLSGGAGNDRLYVDSDDTLIDGGSGFDAVYIEGGNGLTLDMAASNVEFVQDDVGGNDIIDASAAAASVKVYAGGGADTVTGGAGADVLSGGSGNDRLTGAVGNDSLFGGTGADTFVWTQNGGTDTVNDWQDGIDMLEFHEAAGIHDFSDLTTVTHDGVTDVFFGADKLFVVVGAGHIGAQDCLFT